MPESETDIFRDTPVRYLGYTNELGEAFKVFIHRRVYFASYLVAGCYCVGDATSRAHRAYTDLKLPLFEVANTTAEALIWQGLASVAIPGFVINRTVAGYTRLANRLAPRFPTLMARLPPHLQATAVGLACIPLIISPIDHAVDSAIAAVYRPTVNALFPNTANEGGTANAAISKARTESASVTELHDSPSANHAPSS
eukprot:m.15665 g.15665  ORF g.15665 m.15665 type:complete len:198 (-) comp4943_c1_seq1:410-1003(-)